MGYRNLKDNRVETSSRTLRGIDRIVWNILEYNFRRVAFVLKARLAFLSALREGWKINEHRSRLHPAAIAKKRGGGKILPCLTAHVRGGEERARIKGALGWCCCRRRRNASKQPHFDGICRGAAEKRSGTVPQIRQAFLSSSSSS